MHDLCKVAIETKKPRTQRDYKRMLDKYYLPHFKSKRLAEITYENITDKTDDLPPSEKAHSLAVASQRCRGVPRGRFVVTIV
jgi:hypothetical protein